LSIERLEPRALWSTVVPGPEFAVGGAGDFWGAYGRTLASDASGNFVVVRADGPHGNDEVHARLFDAAGAAKNDWFQVDAPGSNWTNYTPNVAMGGNGNFVVTWWQPDYAVLARAFNPAGQPLGPVITVVPPARAVNMHATAAMDDAGDFAIVWVGSKRGQDADLFAQRYSPAGAPVGKQVQVNTTVRGSQQVPSVDMDADGDMLVVWSSPDGSGSGIYGQRLSKAGVNVGAEFRVNTTTGGDQSWPAAAVDAAGNAAVVWYGPDAGGALAVSGQRFTAAGAPAGGEFRVGDAADTWADYPALDMARDGSFLVAWGNSVRAYDASGQSAGAALHTGTGGPASSAQVAALPSGTFLSVRFDPPTGILFGQEFILA
jgi:hypothetical protein